MSTHYAPNRGDTPNTQRDMRQHLPPGWQSFSPTTQHPHIHRGGITGLWALCVLFFCCSATGRKWHSEVLIEVYLLFFSSVLLCVKVWLNFIIKPTGFTVWSAESEERVMTLQTRLFTGLLAAAAASSLTCTYNNNKTLPHSHCQSTSL